MIEKQRALDIIQRMPDDIAADDLVAQLRFALTILRRGDEAATGERVISHEEVVRSLEGDGLLIARSADRDDEPSL